MSLLRFLLQLIGAGHSNNGGFKVNRWRSDHCMEPMIERFYA